MIPNEEYVDKVLARRHHKNIDTGVEYWNVDVLVANCLNQRKYYRTITVHSEAEMHWIDKGYTFNDR